MPVMRFEVECGDGRERLRLAVVMAGAQARELGARLRTGSLVRITGALRETRAHAGAARWAVGVEVVASGIAEVGAA
jgi:primosomal replication protein N